MKIMHLSDLHIGKKLYNYSMKDDQQYVFEQIIAAVKENNPDCIVIAGDIYDVSMPSDEAFAVLEDFLIRLAECKKPVLMISGNHDSARKLSFGCAFMRKSNIFISPVYDGNTMSVTLEDELGKVNFYLLPFIKPATVKPFFPDEEIKSYNDAIRLVVDKMNIDKSCRNVLVAHQFITGSETSDSENVSVGGLDNVDAEILGDFDYVALGHLHRPQNITDRIRYCGTPLKYSFSEADNEKSITIVTLNEKDDLPQYSFIPLNPIHDVVRIKGEYETLISPDFYKDTTYQTDYILAELTDKEEVYNAFYNLRNIYTNLMQLTYSNARLLRTDTNFEGMTDEEIKSLTPIQLFKSFYQTSTGEDMTSEQLSYIEELISGLEKEAEEFTDTKEEE